jgi:hypothetical protein
MTYEIPLSENDIVYLCAASDYLSGQNKTKEAFIVLALLGHIRRQVVEKSSDAEMTAAILEDFFYKEKVGGGGEKTAKGKAGRRKAIRRKYENT